MTSVTGMTSASGTGRQANRELRAAAALCEPSAGTRAALAECREADPAGVVAVLRANKVPLLELAAGPWDDTEPWRAARAGEQRQREELASEFAAISARFSSLGIRPVLFKSAGGLPYRSSNVDLLVRPAQMEAAAAALESMGHLRFTHYREDHKLLYRRFRRGRSVICVHLHEAVSWGKLLILPGDDVADRARAPRGGETGFLVASAEDLLLISLAHSLYETDQIRLADLRALRACASEAGFDWDRVVERTGRRGWTTGFCSILLVAVALERSLYGATRVPSTILDQARAHLGRARWARHYVRRMTRPVARDGPPVMPHPLSKAWSKAHGVALMMTAPDRSPDEGLADVVATGWNLLATRWRLRCRPAILASITGLDGSGKSSAIRVVREAMTLCEIPARVVWSRGGFTVPMEAAKRAARSVMGRGLPGPDAAEDKRRWLSGRLAGALFAATVVTEQSIHYLLRVRAPRWRGISVVCDRFVHDTVADLEVKLGAERWMTRAAAACLLRTAPRPDLAILLRLSPEEAARRKPGDASMEALRRQAATLERMAAVCGLRVVDAGRPEDDVIDEVLDLILRCAFARFGGARPWR